MEFFLTMIMCSAVGNFCLPPHTFPDGYKNAYECMIKGYEESKNKLIEIGEKEVNEHEIYIKFDCIKIKPENKPKLST